MPIGLQAVFAISLALLIGGQIDARGIGIGTVAILVAWFVYRFYALRNRPTPERTRRRFGHPGGWRHWEPTWAQRLQDTWEVITGRCSLHQAWQRGYDKRVAEEQERARLKGEKGKS